MPMTPTPPLEFGEPFPRKELNGYDLMLGANGLVTIGAVDGSWGAEIEHARACVRALAGLRPDKLQALIEACDTLDNAYYSQGEVIGAALGVIEALDALRAVQPQQVEPVTRKWQIGDRATLIRYGPGQFIRVEVIRHIPHSTDTVAVRSIDDPSVTWEAGDDELIPADDPAERTRER